MTEPTCYFCNASDKHRGGCRTLIEANKCECYLFMRRALFPENTTKTAKTTKMALFFTDMDNMDISVESHYSDDPNLIRIAYGPISEIVLHADDIDTLLDNINKVRNYLNGK